jgi:hypothetical protein
MLRLTDLTDAVQTWSPETYLDKVGDFEWVPLDVSLVLTNADAAADAVNVTEIGRPEDLSGPVGGPGPPSARRSFELAHLD